MISIQNSNSCEGLLHSWYARTRDRYITCNVVSVSVGACIFTLLLQVHNTTWENVHEYMYYNMCAYTELLHCTGS